MPRSRATPNRPDRVDASRLRVAIAPRDSSRSSSRITSRRVIDLAFRCPHSGSTRLRSILSFSAAVDALSGFRFRGLRAWCVTYSAISPTRSPRFSPPLVPRPGPQMGRRRPRGSCAPETRRHVRLLLRRADIGRSRSAAGDRRSDTGMSKSSCRPARRELQVRCAPAPGAHVATVSGVARVSGRR